jgi:vacuolar-type H+-ATPase subunit E/Vma4
VDIQAILDGIEEAGAQQIASIQQTADAQVRNIRATAENEAEKQKKRILKDAHARLTRTQAVIEQRAHMQALQSHARSRQKLIEMALEKTQSKLSEIRERSEYPSILSRMISDSLHAIHPSLLDGQKIILHLDERDAKIVQKIELPYQELVVNQFDLQCSGGCEAESEDAFVKVLNTFESRFSRALPEIQQGLSVFFEEKIASS